MRFPSRSLPLFAACLLATACTPAEDSSPDQQQSSSEQSTGAQISKQQQAGGASSAQQPTSTPTAADQEPQELLAGAQISNLVDAASQQLARTALEGAGLPKENIDRFFELVTEYNSAVPTDSLISSGFRDYGTQDPEYDVEALTSAWQKYHGQRYPGTNCRINTFTLAQSLVSMAEESNPDSSLLFLDEESLNNAPKELLTSAERKRFEAFYGAIPTTKSQDAAQHIADIKAYAADRGITFADTKARVISMFSHDTLTDPATLFVGHTGVAVPHEGKILFLEKIAFDMPYQAIVVKDMQQLNDYLMQKYDDGPGLEYGRPVIFDNGEVIEGMRYAKRS
ncbi:DUF4300 family protein [Corynebacterium urealyticum]|uniref:DUF4300 family protein n=1 Tax=Corynebacterium urealyticum TaxID=43771 RepID=A0A5D4FY52_9CORY|nr:DUF4300 family protein [Corynebacterium urealyticum]TYR15037.1 DUF4300 family protein [Corynebacterium urealyticum]TYR18457.1 DUF4300 family protein [Corynebacterium urealyticum]TYR20185.1 DUF4300 family protein [Corynebacterium urealyticum]TYT20268.1 DUF4300 family protein [Corynebacterium urealyticum]